ncbi:unnamed protein product [Oppiella nova]|uniref:Cytochrome c oxidase subunit 6B1 n=1 Tax=Oppiella nova TaxID=334625 RepID=A0A7R9QQF2_9ACAR|nr:unnamed protein product [Oppiella nova]CAG2171257.1 unnamed protein product [Oppiella nova]
MSEKIELKTAPYDPRFPNQNQTRNCYQNYLDYHRCQKVKGDKYEPCQWFKWAYTELCPKAWTEKWDDQRDNVGVYVEDIPMRLSERYRPLDVSAYTQEETLIPDVFDQHYRFSAELYALEVFEFRDKQKRKQLSQSMSNLDLKSDNNRNSLKSQTDDKNEVKKSIRLNPGEILKPSNCIENNEDNCQQRVPALHNMNGVNLMSTYGPQHQHQQPIVQQPLACVSAPHSGQPFNSSHWTTASIYHNSCDLGATSSNTSYTSITANHLSDSQHNLLRSSKSASDLPTLVNSEESVRTTRRQRSHTPPCAPSKPKQNVNEKQTLILNDPYEELSQYSKDFVNSIGSMGFERSRVARAVKHMDNDHKKVIDFLLQVQTLEETGYDCCEAEIALHMNSYQISDAKKFLESLRQLSEVGLDKRDVIKALVTCNNDRDKALDVLLNTQ